MFLIIMSFFSNFSCYCELLTSVVHSVHGYLYQEVLRFVVFVGCVCSFVSDCDRSLTCVGAEKRLESGDMS